MSHCIDSTSLWDWQDEHRTSKSCSLKWCFDDRDWEVRLPHPIGSRISHRCSLEIWSPWKPYPMIYTHQIIQRDLLPPPSDWKCFILGWRCSVRITVLICRDSFLQVEKWAQTMTPKSHQYPNRAKRFYIHFSPVCV